MFLAINGPVIHIQSVKNTHKTIIVYFNLFKILKKQLKIEFELYMSFKTYKQINTKIVIKPFTQQNNILITTLQRQNHYVIYFKYQK